MHLWVHDHTSRCIAINSAEIAAKWYERGCKMVGIQLLFTASVGKWYLQLQIWIQLLTNFYTNWKETKWQVTQERRAKLTNVHICLANRMQLETMGRKWNGWSERMSNEEGKKLANRQRQTVSKRMSDRERVRAI